MNLKEIRLQNNLTQDEAAKILGVTSRTYINYESGKINEETTKKLGQYANALNGFM